MTKAPIVIVWFILSIANAGFVYADLDANFGKSLCKARQHRSDLAFAIGWSLIPIVPIIVTPFLTGFYYSGWRLTSKYETCDA